MGLTAGLALAETPPPVLTKAALMGRITPATDPGFAPVDGGLLRTPVAEAYTRMKDASSRDGVTLKVISATRTFADQRSIWERKWRRATEADPAARSLGIMKYSSMPGTSRHHWGTDLDLNSLSPRWFVDTAEGRKVYAWLTAHAKEYGFCQPYTAKGPARATGYAEERWHWSYQPWSSAFRKQYLETIVPADIAGFSGAASAGTVRSIEDYVGGIDAGCR